MKPKDPTPGDNWPMPFIGLVLAMLFWLTPAHAAEIDLGAVTRVVIMAESSGRPWAVGDKGQARGLMQIQRRTWERYSDLSFDKAFHPKLNRQVGSAILRDIARRYGEKATPARVIYTYNTGHFLGKKPLPQWTKKHPNRIYRSLFREELA